MKDTALRFSFFLCVIAGCAVNPGKTEEPVDINGSVSIYGNPLDDVVLNLQATGKGTQAALMVKKGLFSGKVTPGKYTYYFTPGYRTGGMNRVPNNYLTGAMDRQIVISGGQIDIVLD